MTASASRPIRTAQLVLGWCCVLAYAMVLVFSMPFYAHSPALAAGYALSRAGVSSAELDAVLDAFLAVCRGDDLADSGALVYRAAQAVADMPSGSVGAIGTAMQHPEDAPKSLLASLRYASCRGKAQQLADMMTGDVTLSAAEWQATDEGVRRLVSNVAAYGEERCVECARILERMQGVTDFWQQISYKDMRKAAEAVLAFAEGVSFASLYAMDLAFGAGTCAAVGADLDYLLEVARGLRYDRLMDIAGELPNRTVAVYYLTQYLFVEQGASVSRCRQAFAGLARRFDLPQVLVSPTVWQELEWLSHAPQSPTEEQWTQIGAHVDALWAAATPQEDGV